MSIRIYSDNIYFRVITKRPSVYRNDPIRVSYFDLLSVKPDDKATVMPYFDNLRQHWYGKVYINMLFNFKK